MIRKIVCINCSRNFNLCIEDRNDGWQIRKINIVAHKPERHGIEIISDEKRTFHPLETLKCDSCNCEIKDGVEACAITMWQGPEPDLWEREYGGVEVRV